MPNTQVAFYGLNTGTILSSGGGTAVVKLNGATVDTQLIFSTATTTAFITSNAITTGNTYTITCTGAGSPSGVMTLYTPPQYSDNSTVANAPYIYTVYTDGNSNTTTAQASSVLPNPSNFLPSCWITFWNASTNSALPAGITSTFMISGVPAAGIVDVQVTNAQGLVVSTKLFDAPVYSVTFTGSGAPVGTYYLYNLGESTNVVIV